MILSGTMRFYPPPKRRLGFGPSFSLLLAFVLAAGFVGKRIWDKPAEFPMVPVQTFVTGKIPSRDSETKRDPVTGKSLAEMILEGGKQMALTERPRAPLRTGLLMRQNEKKERRFRRGF